MAVDISLLILPGLPSPASVYTLEAAHGRSIAAVLSKLGSVVKNTQSPRSQRLDIAVTTPIPEPFSSRFEHWQSTFASLYEIVCAKAAEQSIDLDVENGLDIRVFVADPLVEEPPRAGDGDSAAQFAQGPLTDLPSLALSERPYKRLFSVESEDGETILRKYQRLSPGTANLPYERVPGGTILRHNAVADRPVDRVTSKHADHEWVAVGGTFDHLHLGHKLLLFGTALALKTSGDRKMTIGITGDELLKSKKFGEVMESWEVRQHRVAEFLESIMIFSGTHNKPRAEYQDEPGPNGKHVRHTFPFGLTIDYVRISDPFGPTITEKSIAALVISAETRSGGTAVNQKRTELGWSSLDILEIPVLDSKEASAANASLSASDFQNKLSSTEIRKRIVHGTTKERQVGR